MLQSKGTLRRHWALTSRIQPKDFNGGTNNQANNKIKKKIKKIKKLKMQRQRESKREAQWDKGVDCQSAFRLAARRRLAVEKEWKLEETKHGRLLSSQPPDCGTHPERVPHTCTRSRASHGTSLTYPRL